MKGWFSLKLYLEGLKRIKITGIAAAISVILLNAAMPAIHLLDDYHFYDRTVVSVTPFEFMPFGLLMLAFGAVLAYSMFSFLNERNRSDFFHAIPHKRICVYLSFIAAIFTWMLAVLAVSAGINAFLYGFAEHYTVNLSVVLVTPLVFLLASTMVAAFMTLAMTLTGTVVSNFLIFLLLLLFGRTIGQLFVTSLQNLVPIVRYGSNFLDYLEFEFSLPFALLSGEGFTNKPLLIYTAVVTVLVFALGAVSYVFRRSETATKSASSKVFQHIYRSAISLPFFLFIVLTVITDGYDASTQIILLVLALLVYCIFELMTTKKIKSLVKALPMILIPILLSGVFAGTVLITKNVILNQIPEIEEVESIGTQSYRSSYNPTYRQLRTKDAFVDSEEAKEIVLHALEREVQAIRENKNIEELRDVESGKYVEIYSKLTVQIRLKNGKTIGRYIGMTQKEYDSLMALMLESYDYLEAYLDLPTSQEIDSLRVRNYDFSKDQVKRLWASYLLEFSSLSRDQKLEYVEASYRNDELDAIIVGGTYRLKSFTSTYPLIYEFLPNTTQMYLEMAEEKGFVENDMEILEAMIQEIAANGEESLGHCNFSLCATILTGEGAGNEIYFDSIKSDLELSKEDAIKMLDFIAEKGTFSYDSEEILVRFVVTFNDIVVYDLRAEDDSSFSFVYSGVIAETGELWEAYLILSFDKDEWAEFEALTAPYCY